MEINIEWELLAADGSLIAECLPATVEIVGYWDGPDMSTGHRYPSFTIEAITPVSAVTSVRVEGSTRWIDSETAFPADLLPAFNRWLEFGGRKTIVDEIHERNECMEAAE